MTDTAVQPAAAGRPVAGELRRGADRGRHRRRRRAVRRRQLLARPRRVHLEHQDRRGAATASATCSTRRSRAPSRAAGARPSRRPRPTGVTEAWIEFETAVGRGKGHLRLQGRQGVDAADRRSTSSRATRSRAAPAAPRASSTAPTADRETWLEQRRARGRASSATRRQPDVVIVGGGQGGIALGARLRQLGVPTIIVERNERPGDSWRNRYKSLCLHDPVWYDHLPYIKFPENWPVFSPKDKIGDWLEMYTRVMELNYWSSTECQEREATTRTAGEWTVVVERDGADVTLRPKQLVLATGMSGKPNVPEIPGHGRLQGRPAPLVPAPGPGRLRGQAVRRHRLEQLRARHLRGAVGGGRRRDDGAALVDPHRALGHR